MKNFFKKAVSLLLLSAMVFCACASPVSAASFFSSSKTTTTSSEESTYKKYLNEVKSYINSLSTKKVSVEDYQLEVLTKLEDLQEKYSDLANIDVVTSQLSSELLTTDATSASSLKSSLLSAISGLLGDTSSVSSSLTADEVVTINAETAGEFAGDDYNVKLSGNIYYADSDSSKWAVLIHGFTMNGQAIADVLGQMYLDQGYNVFAMDLRGWGDSEGSMSMGYLESLDAWDWLTFLNENYNADEIIVHGISLGGATTAFLSGQEHDGKTLEDLNVIGLVEDCGYTSMTNVISGLLDSFGSNALVSKILGLVGLDADDEDCIKDYLISSGYSGLTEENFDEYQSSAESLAKCTLPILIIHGTSDAMVAFENSTDFYNVAVANTNIKYIQRFEADGENHAFITLGSKENVYKGHVDNFISEAEKVAAGQSVTRISTYVEEEAESVSIVTTLMKGIKLIKNILG